MNSDQKNTDLDFKGSICGRFGFRNVSPMFLRRASIDGVCLRHQIPRFKPLDS
jgi:hypothetical protein